MAAILSRPQCVNTLRPRQNCCHFTNNIFECIFLYEEIVWILFKISLKFVKIPIDSIPALVQIMAWCRPGDKPLSEPMMVSLLKHICITRPQWVKLQMEFDDCLTKLGLTLVVKQATAHQFACWPYHSIHQLLVHEKIWYKSKETMTDVFSLSCLVGFWQRFCKHRLNASNGNIFHVTGPLCREFTGHQWIPRTKASDLELWCFLWSAPE